MYSEGGDMMDVKIEATEIKDILMKAWGT